MALAATLLVTAVGVAAAVRIATAAGRADRAGTVTGSATRLGPHDGELVSAYLARATAALDRIPDRPAGYALVAFDHYLTPAQVPTLAGTVPMVRALIRVPLPRVQTEIVDVPARTRADIAGGMGAAAARLDATRAGADPVSAAVARAQAARLREPCACVMGIVVHADRGALVDLDHRAGVRAVQPAPPGEPLGRLAFAPLLPEQRVRVEPPPDDGAPALVGRSPGPPWNPSADPSPAQRSGAGR